MPESDLPSDARAGSDPTMHRVPDHVLAGILLAMVVGPRNFFRATRLRASARALDRLLSPERARPLPQRLE